MEMTLDFSHQGGPEIWLPIYLLVTFVVMLALGALARLFARLFWYMLTAAIVLPIFVYFAGEGLGSTGFKELWDVITAGYRYALPAMKGTGAPLAGLLGFVLRMYLVNRRIKS